VAEVFGGLQRLFVSVASSAVTTRPNWAWTSTASG
jgi:hypothetical protein